MNLFRWRKCPQKIAFRTHIRFTVFLVALTLCVAFTITACKRDEDDLSVTYQNSIISTSVNDELAAIAESTAVNEFTGAEPASVSKSSDTQTDISDGNTDALTDVDAAAVAKAINTATAKAVAAGYHWARTAKYIQPVDVGNATGAINKIIKAIDPNSDLSAAAGDFIGIGKKEKRIVKGCNAANQIDFHGESYALRATYLRAEDLKNLRVYGNSQTFDIANAAAPKQENATSISRLTNDILAQEQVAAEIKSFVSAATVNSLVVDYTNIKVTLVIENGELKEFKYSYDANVKELGIKFAFFSIKATAAMHVDGAYTNFVYQLLSVFDRQTTMQ